MTAIKKKKKHTMHALVQTTTHLYIQALVL